jgi:N-formylglutamate amidohydrolase
MKKLILHVPHAATSLPNQEGFIRNKEKIQQEITKLTDWYTDDLFHSVTPELREEVIQNYYRPHHSTLTFAVQTQLDMKGSCLIVDCHSFPSTPLLKGLDQSINRPDFNIGTDAFHTPQVLIDRAINHFKNNGYSLGIDWPYSGTIVPMAFYKKDKRVQSIMLEVNRKLYLKEPGREKSENYTATKEIVQGFLRVMKNN